MKKTLLSLGFLGLTALISGCQTTTATTVETTRQTHDYSVYEDGIDYGEELWNMPSYYFDPSHDVSSSGIQGLWIRSDYQGEESYAFAYLGVPENAEGKAVLLLHGGGGTAYAEWVVRWMDQGYIALAIDLEGHVPKPEGNLNSYPQDLYVKSSYSTPHNSNYGDAALPIEQTWMHYATRTAILAHSFLQHFEGVDPLKVGVVGISWGGVIASIITGYDDRFAFSIPIYCSLNQIGTGTTLAGYYATNPEAQIWDSDAALSQVSTPIHFVVSNIDANCRLDSIALTLSRVKNGSLTVLKDWLHSHGIAVEALEPYAFAEAVLGETDHFRFDTEPTFEAGSVSIHVPAGEILDSAVIVYSTDPLSLTSGWSKRRATLTELNLDYEIPSGTTMFYLSVVDGSGFTWSTPLVVSPTTDH